MSSRQLFFPLALAVLVVTLGKPAPAATPEDQLIWRGDQISGRAIMDDLSKEYAREKKGRITLQSFSTVSGLDAVANGSADLAGSARGKYAGRAEEANIQFVPTALDAATLITHPRNPANNLTLQQIHDIYYGRITNWKVLGGADTPINLYAIAAPLDGVEFSLRELVFRNGDQRVAAPRLYLNTTKLEEAIALDPAGLGLSTLASVSGNKGVKMLSVEGIAPSVGTVSDASYPLFITLYVAERADSPQRDAIDRFFAFLDTPAAKQILRRHQLVPYADASAAIAHNSERMAFIDARLGRAVVAIETAATPAATPVSAPRAMLASKVAIAPAAASTEVARENLARAEAKTAAKQKAAAAAKPNARPAAPKPIAAATPAKPVSNKVASNNHNAAPARTKSAAKTPDKPSAKKPASVAKAVTPQKPAPAPATFGNVNGGASGH